MALVPDDLRYQTDGPDTSFLSVAEYVKIKIWKDGRVRARAPFSSPPWLHRARPTSRARTTHQCTRRAKKCL
jgi:hypothetical protein